MSFLKAYENNSVLGMADQESMQLIAIDQESRRLQMQRAHRAQDDPRYLVLAAYARGKILPIRPGCWRCGDSRGSTQPSRM